MTPTAMDTYAAIEAAIESNRARVAKDEAQRQAIIAAFNSPALTDITGTLDDLEPHLRRAGFVALQMMSGPVDLATVDPYGMRRLGSANIQTERWAHHIWQGRYVELDGRPYLTDAKPATAPFVNGLFPLLRAGEV